MTTSASGNLSVDSLLYGYVKEKNPCLLTQLFPKEKCRELEKLDYLYDSKTLPTMLQKYRKIHTKLVEQNGRQKDHAAQKRCKPRSEVHVKQITVTRNLYDKDKMHRRFCRIADLQTSVDLVVFNYFDLKGDHKALEMIFDGNKREKTGKMVANIDVPTVVRMAAHRRKEKSKSANKGFNAISMCQLCKKSFRGFNSALKNHIGLHEEIPSYCFIEGCDKFFKQFRSFFAHLQRNHLLYQKDWTPEQGHQLYSMKLAYNKKAGRFLDKYFPPESFMGCSDRRIRNATELEDEKCASCGKIVKVARSRQRHVVYHLNLSYACVVEGCQAATEPTNFGTHLKHHHAKRVRQLNVQERHQHKLNKEHFNKVMKEELPKYFPRKSGNDEE